MSSTDLYASQKVPGLLTRVRSAWELRKPYVIAAEILRHLKIINPLLEQKIAVNFLRGERFVVGGRLVPEQVLPAAVFVHRVISSQYPDRDFTVKQALDAVIAATRTKVRLGWGGFSSRHVSVSGYRGIVRLVVEGRPVREIAKDTAGLEAAVMQLGATDVRITNLEKDLAQSRARAEKSLEALGASEKLIMAMGELMQTTLTSTDLEHFYHRVAEIAYQGLGCDRAIVFIYDREKNALVARKNHHGNPYAGRNQVKIADIEAFLEGELVVPLDAEGQKALSDHLIRRAIKLAPTSAPGSETARRLLRNLPMLLRGHEPRGEDLEGEEALLSQRHEIQDRFMRANMEALNRGFRFSYEGEGLAKKVVLLKEVLEEGGRVVRIVLDELSWLQLEQEPEYVRVREKDQSEARQVGQSQRLSEMLLATGVMRRFMARSEHGKKRVPVTVYLTDAAVLTVPNEVVWKKIWDRAESIITLTFRTGRGYRVRVDNPQVKVSPALIAMWGTTSFATAPIIVRRHVQKGGGTVVEEEVVGMIGLDNDVTQMEFSDAAMRAIQTLADMVALQYMHLRIRAAYRGVVGEIFDADASSALERMVLAGEPLQLDARPVKGVLAHVRVYDGYDMRSIPKAADGDAPRLQQFLEGFKTAVAACVQRHKGTFAGGDRAGSYLFWGSPQEEFSSYTVFAGAAVEAMLDLAGELRDLLRQSGLTPLPFVGIGMIADGISTGVVEVEGERRFVVKGKNVPRVKTVAELRAGELMVSREVVESLSEDWQRVFIDGLVARVATIYPRAREARALLEGKKEAIRDILLQAAAPCIQSLVPLLDRVVFDRQAKSELDELSPGGQSDGKRKRVLAEQKRFFLEHLRKQLGTAIDAAVNLLYESTDRQATTLLTAEQVRSVYARVIGDLRGVLERQVQVVLNADHKRAEELVRYVAQAVFARLALPGAYGDPQTVIASAGVVLASILENRPEFSDKRGLKDDPRIISLVQDLVRQVVEKKDELISARQLGAVYEGMPEKEKDRGFPVFEWAVGDFSTSTEGEAQATGQVSAARAILAGVHQKLWLLWSGFYPAELSSALAEVGKGRAQFMAWQRVAEEANAVWGEQADPAKKYFEGVFETFLRERAQQKRSLSPLQLKGEARVFKDKRLIGGKAAAVTQWGIFNPVLDLETGRTVAYEVDFSLDPSSAAFPNIAEGIFDLLVERFHKRQQGV